MSKQRMKRSNMKQLKHTTVIKYDSKKAWNAVLKRSSDYRLETGSIYRLNGGQFEFCAPYSTSRNRAIQELVDINAIDLTPVSAYQKLMGAR